MSARKIWVVIPAAIVVVALGLLILHWCGVVVSGLPAALQPWIQTIALVATAAIVWNYTRETAQLRKAAQEQVEVAQKQMEEVRLANEFDAYTRIYEHLNKPTSWEMRDLLCQHSRGYLASTCGIVLTSDFIEKRQDLPSLVNTARVLKEIKPDETKLAKFNEQLSKIQQVGSSKEGRNIPINFREVIERVIADLDIIAGPLAAGHAFVEPAATLFRRMIKKTAPFILPYVAIQMRLLGDENYQANYLKLLKHLGIDTMDVPVPH